MVDILNDDFIGKDKYSRLTRHMTLDDTIDVLLLKLPSKFSWTNERDLFQRICGYWRIDPVRLSGIEVAFVLKDNVVIREVEIGTRFMYDNIESRVSFMDVRDCYPELGFKGYRLDYTTLNPATIASVEKVRKMIVWGGQDK